MVSKGVVALVTVLLSLSIAIVSASAQNNPLVKVTITNIQYPRQVAPHDSVVVIMTVAYETAGRTYPSGIAGVSTILD
jgi:hypothetical protein